MTDPLPQTAEPPGRPRGSPLLLTPEQLDSLATVRPEDVSAARNLWRELCPKWAVGLPDAVTR